MSAAPDITAAAVAAGLSAVDTSEMGFQATKGNINERDVKVILEAAVPVLLASHEKQVREKIAGELRARVADITEMTGPRAARRRAFHAAANSVAPEPSLEEVAVAFARGDYAACYLDDAGQPIARGSRPAADGGGGE